MVTRSCQVVPGLDQVGVGWQPGDREGIGIVEPLVGGLGFPLGANRDGELVCDLPEGHLPRRGAGGLPRSAPNCCQVK